MSSYSLGIALSVLGSVASNLGVNVQKYSFLKETVKDEKFQRKYFRQPLWVLGFFLVVLGSVGDFAALSMTAESTVAPLGSVTLVTNVCFAHYWLKERLTRIDLLGTALIIFGSIVAVYFGNHSNTDYDIDELVSLYGSPLFIVYAVITFVFGLFLYLVCRRLNPLRASLVQLLKQYDSLLEKNRQADADRLDSQIDPLEKRYADYEKFHPFALCALSGVFGGQSVMFGKMVSECISESIAGKSQLGSPAFYLFVAAMLFTIFAQLHFLAIALKFFDALYSVPVFQCFWIGTSAIGGACYFGEFSHLSAVQAVFFPGGILITVSGVWVMSRRKMGGRIVHIVSKDKATEDAETAQRAKLADDDRQLKVISVIGPDGLREDIGMGGIREEKEYSLSGPSGSSSFHREDSGLSDIVSAKEHSRSSSARRSRDSDEEEVEELEMGLSDDDEEDELLDDERKHIEEIRIQNAVFAKSLGLTASLPSKTAVSVDALVRNERMDRIERGLKPMEIEMQEMTGGRAKYADYHSDDDRNDELQDMEDAEKALEGKTVSAEVTDKVALPRTDKLLALEQEETVDVIHATKNLLAEKLKKLESDRKEEKLKSRRERREKRKTRKTKNKESNKKNREKMKSNEEASSKNDETEKADKEGKDESASNLHKQSDDTQLVIRDNGAVDSEEQQDDNSSDSEYDDEETETKDMVPEEAFHIPPPPTNADASSGEDLASSTSASTAFLFAPSASSSTLSLLLPSTTTPTATSSHTVDAGGGEAREAAANGVPTGLLSQARDAFDVLSNNVSQKIIAPVKKIVASAASSSSTAAAFVEPAAEAEFDIQDGKPSTQQSNSQALALASPLSVSVFGVNSPTRNSTSSSLNSASFASSSATLIAEGSHHLASSPQGFLDNSDAFSAFSSSASIQSLAPPSISSTHSSNATTPMHSPAAEALPSSSDSHSSSQEVKRTSLESISHADADTHSHEQSDVPLHIEGNEPNSENVIQKGSAANIS